MKFFVGILGALVLVEVGVVFFMPGFREWLIAQTEMLSKREGEEKLSQILGEKDQDKKEEKVVVNLKREEEAQVLVAKAEPRSTDIAPASQKNMAEFGTGVQASALPTISYKVTDYASTSPTSTVSTSSTSNVISSSSIRILELMAGSETNADAEYVRFFNDSNEVVSLKGFALKKKTKSGIMSNLVAKEAFSGDIGPRGYFIVAHSEYAGKADLRYSNKSSALAYKDNSVLLYNAEGVLIDEVSYSTLEKDQLWHR